MIENFKVRIPNTEFYLESNKTYRIIGKKDPSSPKGFQERGITKFEHPLNGESAIAVYNGQRNLWDTGLYESSPCYGREQRLGEENVKIFNEYLIPKLKEVFPDGALSPKSDNKYWDSYRFPLNQNLTVATNTPESFLGLWFALIGYTVAPEEMQDYPIYREMKTPYLIVDRKERSSNEQNNKFEKSKSIASFVHMLQEDRETLISILNYVGFRASKDTEDSILNSQFMNWLENKQDSLNNAKNFNEAVKRFSGEKGLEELEIYNTLDKGVKNKKIRYERSEYYIGDKSIGNNLKESAKLVNGDDSLKEALFNLKINDN